MTSPNPMAVAAFLIAASSTAMAQTPDQIALELARTLASQPLTQTGKTAAAASSETAKGAAGQGVSSAILKQGATQ